MPVPLPLMTMAYKNIDRKRLNYLLSLGASEFELRTFFKECRSQLIQAGARVQNLPTNGRDRIRVITQLPPAAEDVLRNWFGKHVTMVDPEAPDALIELYRRYEEADGEVPEDIAKRYARASLVHLFAENPPQAFVEFLRSPIGGSEEVTERDTSPQAEEWSATDPGDFASLGNAIVALLSGSNVDRHLDGLPPHLSTFISGLQSVSKGQHGDARTALDSLAGSPLQTVLDEYIRRDAAKAVLGKPIAAGLTFAELPLFEGEFDYQRDEVLAYCTKADKVTAVFVQPIAVARMGGLQMLDDATRKAIFPETGDVISFAGGAHPRQPTRGEIGVWRVTSHETQKATRFHLSSEKRPVYEVLQIPFASTDHDSVRQYLLEDAAKNTRASLQPVLFQLSDGLILGARGAWADLARAEVLDQGLFGWTSLQAIRLEGREFVLGPLPKERLIYECGTIGYVLRRLLKNVGGKLPGGITRAQIRDLSQFLDSTDHVVDVLRIQRLKAELGALAANEEALTELISALQGLPEIKSRVDDMVEKEVAKKMGERTDLQSEIAKLKGQRDEWDGLVRKQQSEHKKLREETSNLVKAAFQRAKNESIATLADVAIFQALSGTTTSTATSSKQPNLPEATVHEIEASRDDIAQVLVALGCGRQRSVAIATLGKVTLDEGLILVLTGVAARQIARRWCALLGGGVLVDATVGMMDPTLLAGALARVPTVPALSVVDANLSAVDIYGKSLHDLVVERISERPSEGPRILMTLSSSVGALPYPAGFRKVSVMLDLDARTPLRAIDGLEELEVLVTDIEDGSLYASLWRNAADRMKRALEDLDGEARVMALSLLAAPERKK